MRLLPRFSGLILLLALAAFSARADVTAEAVLRGDHAFAKNNFSGALVDYKVALGLMDGMLQHDDRKSALHYKLGVCLHHTGQLEAAAKSFRMSLASAASDYPYNSARALGVTLCELQRLSEARAVLETAVRNTGRRDAMLLLDLGSLLVRMNNYAEAERLLRAALNTGGSEAARAHNNLGVVLVLLNRVDEAELQFSSAVALSHGELSAAQRNLDNCRVLRTHLAPVQLAGLLRGETPAA